MSLTSVLSGVSFFSLFVLLCFVFFFGFVLFFKVPSMDFPLCGGVTVPQRFSCGDFPF